LTGGKIFTYAAGTTTNQATYTTSAGNIPHSNPIILDASGRVPSGGEIWLTDGFAYKFILRDANDVLIATYDNVTGINSNFVAFTNQQEIQTATAGQTVFNLTTVTYQPATNSLTVFVDGVNQYGPGAQYAYVETDDDTVTFVNGLHVGAEVKFTTSQLNSSASQSNAFQVSYTPPFTGSTSTNVGLKLAQYVNVKDFGAVGDGITDDTAAIQTAVDYGIANGLCLIFSYGNYAVTEIVIQDAVYTFNIQSDGAKFSGIATTAKNGIFDIVNCVDFSMTGSYRFEMSALSRPNYDCAVRIRAQLGTAQASKWITLENATFRECNVGLYIGTDNISYAVSEINFFGLKFKNTPLCVRLGGSQTGASFNGCDITSEYNLGDNYLTIPQPIHNTFLMEGGFIKVVGGSIVTDISAQPSIVLTPCNDAFGVFYPTFIATGVHIESNLAQLCVIYNPNGYTTNTASSDSACAIFNSCTGFAGTDTAQDFVSTTDSGYFGLIDITDCNFYSANVRTAFNISSASANTRIKTDSVSLGKNFLNWMAGVSNGILLHSTQPVMEATGLGTQTIVAGVGAVLVFANQVTTGDLGRYSSRYNPSLGTFNVPAGGFTSLNINASCQWTGGGELDLAVRKNGTVVAFGSSIPNPSGSGSANVNTTLYNLAIGDVIEIYAVAYTNTATFNNNITNYLKMTGSTM
jgi:hypothetical protein